MIEPTTPSGGLTATSASRGAPGSPAGGVLGKDEFLKLLVAQLQNQDPLSPSGPEELAVQLAQFSSLEQLVNINETLAGQSGGNQVLDNTSVLSTIGRRALVSGETLNVDAGNPPRVHFSLETGAENVALRIFDEEGSRVVETSLGPRAAGVHRVSLDEIAPDLEPGSYRFEVEAGNEAGETLSVRPLSEVEIDGVRFTQEGPLLLSGGREISLGEVIQIQS